MHSLVWAFFTFAVFFWGMQFVQLQNIASMLEQEILDAYWKTTICGAWGVQIALLVFLIRMLCAYVRPEGEFYWRG